ENLPFLPTVANAGSLASIIPAALAANMGHTPAADQPACFKTLLSPGASRGLSWGSAAPGILQTILSEAVGRKMVGPLAARHSGMAPAIANLIPSLIPPLLTELQLMKNC